MARRPANVAQFRNRRRWRLPGLSPRPPRPPKFHKPRKKPWRQAFRETRPIVLLIALVTLWIIADDAALVEPPSFLQTEPETVAGSFTRCGPGRGHHCVIDGDTFKIGERDIRVVGIDTPEVKASCPEEAAGAERATAALQAWLNRGSFIMTGRIDEATDHYGRELRVVKRIRPDGSEDRLADHMLDGGWARRYLGGWRGGWC